MGRKDYKRWEDEDEYQNAINMEEQVALDNNSECSGLRNVILNNGTSRSNTNSCTSSINCASPSDFHHQTNASSTSDLLQNNPLPLPSPTTKEKGQLLAAFCMVLLLGFIVGFSIGARRIQENYGNDTASVVSHFKYKHHGRWRSDHSHHNKQESKIEHDNNEHVLKMLSSRISARNIEHNLKVMSRKDAGKGKDVAKGIQDLWRGFGVSVRIEQHKTILTKSPKRNSLDVVDDTGTILYSTQKNETGVSTLINFSPSGHVKGPFVYANYGRQEDFIVLNKSSIPTNGSIALVRFGKVHPSHVVKNAMEFNIKGLVFFPDPEDFGPFLPSTATYGESLLLNYSSFDGEILKRSKRDVIPCHTISSLDAKKLFEVMTMNSTGNDSFPQPWTGGLNATYSFGGALQGHLDTFNEDESTTIYNVIAAIPGSIESDRYVIIGCAHDSLGASAGDPGIGLAMTTEILRAFTSSSHNGWKPRRSVLFVSWDAHLYSNLGVFHWLQTHNFEMVNRVVAYVDLTRPFTGNVTLEAFMSPIFKELLRKAINRVQSLSMSKKSHHLSSNAPNIRVHYAVGVNEPSFLFIGKLGVPFIRLSVKNLESQYPMFNSKFDTVDNFKKLIDPGLRESEAMSKVITEMILLLGDSSAIPVNVYNYVKEIRRGLDVLVSNHSNLVESYNLSFKELEKAVGQLESVGENYKQGLHNRSIRGLEDELLYGTHTRKVRKEMLHRMLNDKLMLFEKSLLSRPSNELSYRHQVIGVREMEKKTQEEVSALFPQLRSALSCLQKVCNERDGENYDSALLSDSLCSLFQFTCHSNYDQHKSCERLKILVAQKISSLIRSLASATSILQSSFFSVTETP